MSWYDGTYRKPTQMYETLTLIDDVEKWQLVMNDSVKINLPNYEDLFKLEYGKIKNVLENHDIDVMMTHVLPVTEYRYQSEQYRDGHYQMYYCFDGMNLIQEHEPSHWVFGHSHEKSDKEVLGTKTRLLSNAFGYPDEMTEKFTLEWFEIIKE